MLKTINLKRKSNFWVIEIDEESVRYLENHYPELKSHIYFGDFLKLDLSPLLVFCFLLPFGLCSILFLLAFGFRLWCRVYTSALFSLC